MLVTDREAPPDVPTTDTLRDLEDPDTITPAEMRLGPNVLLMVPNPPQLGETRDIVIRVRCTAVGDEQRKVDGDRTHFCRNTIVTAWVKGQPEPAPKPDPDEPQPGLFDHGDEPTDEDNPDGGAGDRDGEPETIGDILNSHDPSGLDEFRPQFSDTE